MIGGILKSAFKSAGGIGVGYGVMKASGGIADYLEQDRAPGVNVGGAYTAALRGVGFLAGGSMMATSAVRGAGNIAAPLYGRAQRNKFTSVIEARDLKTRNRSGSSYMSSKSSPNNAVTELRKRNISRRNAAVGGDVSAMRKLGGGRTARNIGRMQNFSTGRMLGQGAGLARSKFIAPMGRGLVKAPFMPFKDVASYGLGKMPGRAGKLGRQMGAYTSRKSPGARAFGWGVAAGGVSLFAQTGQTFHGATIDEGRQIAGGQGLALAGQQMYDPNSGRAPRRMDPTATAGLTQSLHRLR